MSNDPTNQETINNSRDIPIHRFDCSSRAPRVPVRDPGVPVVIANLVPYLNERVPDVAVRAVTCGAVSSGAYLRRASEKGDQLVDGGRTGGERLSWVESTRARSIQEVVADEGQRLLGDVIGQQFNGLPGGLSEIPAVGEEIVEADLQSFGSGGHPERTAESSSRIPGLSNASRKLAAELASERLDEIGLSLVSDWPRGRLLIFKHRREHAVHPGQVVDQLPHSPFGARCRRGPLSRLDVADQATDHFKDLAQLLDRRRPFGCAAPEVAVICHRLRWGQVSALGR